MTDQNSTTKLDRHETDPALGDLVHWNKIRSGDTAEFSFVFKKYYVPLYQFAGRFVKDVQIAEDIIQNVFVSLWIEREKRDIKTSLKSYLYQMVRNQSLNHLKRAQRTIALEDSEADRNKTSYSPEDNAADKEFHMAVRRAIDRLPPRCRQVYLMKRYENLKYTEIAQILDISVNTVKTQMKRALKSLLKQLDPFLNWR